MLISYINICSREAEESISGYPDGAFIATNSIVTAIDFWNHHCCSHHGDIQCPFTLLPLPGQHPMLATQVYLGTTPPPSPENSVVASQVSTDS
jgi:hypothetical protein